MTAARLRRPARLAGLTIAILVFLFGVWPTPWRYEHACGRLVRVRRWGATAEVLLDGGWQALRPSAANEDVRRKESELLELWVASVTICPPNITARPGDPFADLRKP